MNKLREIEDRWFFGFATVKQKTDDVNWIFEDILKDEFEIFNLFFGVFPDRGNVFCFRVVINNINFDSSEMKLDSFSDLTELVVEFQNIVVDLKSIIRNYNF